VHQKDIRQTIYHSESAQISAENLFLKAAVTATWFWPPKLSSASMDKIVN
jgi:hypothetical protein